MNSPGRSEAQAWDPRAQNRREPQRGETNSICAPGVMRANSTACSNCLGPSGLSRISRSDDPGLRRTFAPGYSCLSPSGLSLLLRLFESPGVLTATTNHEKSFAALKMDRPATEVSLMVWMRTGASFNAERPPPPAAEVE